MIYQTIQANDTQAVSQTFQYLLPSFNYSIKVVAIVDETEGPGVYETVVTGMSWIFFWLQSFVANQASTAMGCCEKWFGVKWCHHWLKLPYVYLFADPLPKVNYEVIPTPTNITISIPLQDEFIDEFRIDFGNQSVVRI